jgi:hypothetical protein
MKNFLFSIITAFCLGVLLTVGVNLAAPFEVLNPIDGGILTATGGFVLGLANFAGVFPNGLAFALQKEVWVADIMENLFNGAEFISYSVDDSPYVSNKTVHRPQAGGAPSVTKNRSSFPATITERTDTVLDYDIDNYTTDPILVRNFDEVQISYQKRENVMSEHRAKLTERIGDEIAVKWSPSASATRVLRTTGADTSELANATATGTRKRIVKEDVARMAKQLDRDNAPKEGRYLLLNPTMYYELFEIDALVRMDYMNKTALPNGVINQLFGFNILVRNVVTLYNNVSAGVLKAVGAAEATTDCLGGLAWSKYMVARALGSIDVYLNEKRAEFYGDIMSAEVNFGGSKLRTDSKGVVAIAQAVGA